MVQSRRTKPNTSHLSSGRGRAQSWFTDSRFQLLLFLGYRLKHNLVWSLLRHFIGLVNTLWKRFHTTTPST